MHPFWIQVISFQKYLTGPKPLHGKRTIDYNFEGIKKNHLVLLYLSKIKSFSEIYYFSTLQFYLLLFL